jgi:hypothetical protein
MVGLLRFLRRQLASLLVKRRICHLNTRYAGDGEVEDEEKGEGDKEAHEESYYRVSGTSWEMARWRLEIPGERNWYLVKRGPSTRVSLLDDLRFWIPTSRFRSVCVRSGSCSSIAYS